MKFRILLFICLLVVPEFLSAEGVVLIHRPRQSEPDTRGNPRFVVKDADGHKGTAQAAVPGKSKVNGTICSFYSYARPAGIYRVTWRVKVDDNTIDSPVFKAGTGGGSIVLKGTDFKAANTYEDFSYTAEKGEGGFFGVSSVWPGKGTVLVDSITVKSEKLFTEREQLQKKGGLKLPDVWSFPPSSPPRIHIAKGLWWDFFGLSEAMAELGGATFSSSYHGRGQGGSSLRYFPGSWRDLMSHNVMVLANVDAAALRAHGRLKVEEFVNNGGGLLILGGPYSLDNGGYKHTALGRLLPCNLEGGRRDVDDAVMQPTSDAQTVLPADLTWHLKPQVMWAHPIEAKPGATVLVTANGKPMVVVGTSGKGRVAVIAASAEGDPGPHELAFWEWGDMPRMVAAICQWVADAPKDEVVHKPNEALFRELEQLAVPNPDDEDNRQGKLATLLSKCRDKAFAREILSTVSNAPKPPDRRFVEAVERTVRPFVDKSFQDEVEALLDSGETGKASLALRLLGLCRLGNADETLTKFLEDGTSAFEKGNDPEDLLGTGGLSLDAGLEIGGNERLKLSAIFGIGDLGDISLTNALRKITREFSNKRQVISEADDVPDLNENIYQQSLAARCRLGDKTAIGPFFDAILRNASEIEQFMNAFDVMLLNKDDKKLMNMRLVGRIRLPILDKRQRLCMSMMSQIPQSLLIDVAREVTDRNHANLTAFAFAALSPTSKRKLTIEMAPALLHVVGDSDIIELRRLAFRYGMNLKDDATSQKLGELLRSLAGSDDPKDVTFALRSSLSMAEKVSGDVVKRASEHSDVAVKRLAALYSR